nr:PREDICTED: TMV resistance protein N-like [Daucus carota subsp. sativus]
MARVSQTPTSSVSTSIPTRWDVFLSFRALVQAIKDSKSYIVVFSEDYASSRWCLDELVEIYNSYETMKRLVVPVYYNIDPSDVRHQTGSFKHAFVKHQSRSGADIDKVKKWRFTPANVATFSGKTMSAKRSEADIVNEIVDIIHNEIGSDNLYVAKYPVGLDSRVKEITALFSSPPQGVTRIGIYGMGGVGKTTLAKALYNQLLLGSFTGICFLANVREVSGTFRGLESLQQKLINNVLKSKKKFEVPDVEEGIKFIRERLCSAKVLLLIDDIDNPRQYESFIGSFASGSVVITTTRDQEILEKIEVEPKFQYRVNELDDAESLTLFTRYAFGSAKSNDTLMALSKVILHLAGGLPLALIVFGAYLSTQSLLGWKSYIEKLQRNPDNTIQQNLIVSLDTLERDDPKLKKMFLDIACFFIGRKKEVVVTIMETYYSYVDHNIDILRKRCLLTTNDDGELRMHDLLRDMGREVARNNSPDEPGKHSRLWISKDIRDVLKNDKGTEAIEGIIHDNKFESYYAVWKESLNVETFKRMRNLRFLQLSCVHLTGSFEGALEDLRWFCWDLCPLERLPRGFHPEKLVILELTSCSIKMWEIEMVFENLKSLDLSYSMDLSSTPDFRKLPFLETLRLVACKSLKEVHISIGSLKRLVSLNLCNCVNLRSLQDSICNLRALKSLNISGCSSLEALPAELGNIKSLNELNAERLSVTNLPDSIGCLDKLVELRLSYNMNLDTLPDNICNLRLLGVLHISDCSRMKAFPLEFGKLESLKKLNAMELNISILPNSLGNLRQLVYLNIHSNYDVETLPDSICNLRALEVLKVGQCFCLKELPEGLGYLESLTRLDAQSLEISEIPSSIGSLSNLVVLILSCNTNLKTLPDTLCTLRSLEILDISKCEKLETLPDHLFKNTRLRQINARHSTMLRKFPGISQLSNLKHLDLTGCCNLLSIAELPPNLKVIRANGCKSLKSLPDLSNLKQLKRLNLRNCSALTEIQGLEELTSLKVLHLTGCDSSLLACIFTRHFFQIYAEFGHEIRIYTGEFPEWISPSSSSEEPTVSLDLWPDGMHQTNTDTEEFLDCISESCCSGESRGSSDLLPDVSHDFLGMHESSTDTEEYSDGFNDSSESCYSEESMVLSYNLISHNMRGLDESNSHTEEFPDWIGESSSLNEADIYSDLPPNLSHSFLGMILFFVPFQTYTLTYNAKNSSSDFLWESKSFDGSPELVMVIVPRSMFTVRDGDGIELTSETVEIYGIHLLYKPENHLESD